MQLCLAALRPATAPTGARWVRLVKRGSRLLLGHTHMGMGRMHMDMRMCQGSTMSGSLPTITARSRQVPQVSVQWVVVVWWLWLSDHPSALGLCL